MRNFKLQLAVGAALVGAVVFAQGGGLGSNPAQGTSEDRIKSLESKVQTLTLRFNQLESDSIAKQDPRPKSLGVKSQFKRVSSGGYFLTLNDSTTWEIKTDQAERLAKIGPLSSATAYYRGIGEWPYVLFIEEGFDSSVFYARWMADK